MDRNSPLFLIISGGPVLVVPVGPLIDNLKNKKICLNCEHFHQTADWRDKPEGIYMPRGECRAHAPLLGDFPKLHAGKQCDEFKAK